MPSRLPRDNAVPPYLAELEHLNHLRRERLESDQERKDMLKPGEQPKFRSVDDWAGGRPKKKAKPPPLLYDQRRRQVTRRARQRERDERERSAHGDARARRTSHGTASRAHNQADAASTRPKEFKSRAPPQQAPDFAWKQRGGARGHLGREDPLLFQIDNVRALREPRPRASADATRRRRARGTGVGRRHAIAPYERTHPRPPTHPTQRPTHPTRAHTGRRSSSWVRFVSKCPLAAVLAAPAAAGNGSAATSRPSY